MVRILFTKLNLNSCRERRHEKIEMYSIRRSLSRVELFVVHCHGKNRLLSCWAILQQKESKDTNEVWVLVFHA